MHEREDVKQLLLEFAHPLNSVCDLPLTKLKSLRLLGKSAVCPVNC